MLCAAKSGGMWRQKLAEPQYAAVPRKLWSRSRLFASVTECGGVSGPAGRRRGKPPAYGLRIGPVGAVSAAPGRKVVVAYPSLDCFLSRSHRVAYGSQPHQHQRTGRFAVGCILRNISVWWGQEGSCPVQLVCRGGGCAVTKVVRILCRLCFVRVCCRADFRFWPH
jgi:hypothetical protein